MRGKTFRGGVHPPDCKQLTRDHAVKTAALPSSVRIPLAQNAGAPPRCIVKPGQYVKTGEKIAEASGGISVPIHASISGKIASVSEIPVPYGGMGLAVEIEGDGKDEKCFGKDFRADPFSIGREEIIERIKEAGLVGLGGAEFPTHVKLSPPAGKRVECIIINGAECEPYLSADHRLMLERPDDVIAGARVIASAVGAREVFIGIESNKGDAFDAISRKAAMVKGVTPVLLEVKYPQGAEKQLIYSILRREVPSRGLPVDVGVVVQNVGTAVAVWEAVSRGKPLYERVVTVSGTAVMEPGNMLVRIGTSFAEVIAQCGGLSPDAALLIMGGPMMGIAQWTTEVPVVKGTSGIIALRECPASSRESGACIRCGRCLEVCPMGLSPALIRQAAEKGRWDLAEQYGAADCIECGACAYVCTTYKNQVQLYKIAKSMIDKEKKKSG